MAVASETTGDVAPADIVDAGWEVACVGIRTGYHQHNNNIVLLESQPGPDRRTARSRHSPRRPRGASHVQGVGGRRIRPGRNHLPNRAQAQHTRPARRHPAPSTSPRRPQAHSQQPWFTTASQRYGRPQAAQYGGENSTRPRLAESDGMVNRDSPRRIRSSAATERGFSICCARW